MGIDLEPMGFAHLGHLATEQKANKLLIPIPAKQSMEMERNASAAEDLDAPFEDDADPAKLAISVEDTRLGDRCVPVFDPSELDKAAENLKELSRELQDRTRPLLIQAGRHGGYRELPDVKPAIAKLKQARDLFENLADPIDKLITELSLAGAMDPEEFRISPILLVGDSGIGKTFLSMKLADSLGVPMEKWGAGNVQASFQLVGGSPQWNNTMPGMTVSLLAKSTSASPVFLLDEIDKANHQTGYPVLPCLLDLLDGNTSKNVTDEFFRMRFDASRMLFVLTANDLGLVPGTLLSRVDVYEVPRPEAAQRLRIINYEFDQLRRKTHKRIHLNVAAGEALAERKDIDLRHTNRILRESFATAMHSHQRVAMPKIPTSKRRSIGFAS